MISIVFLYAVDGVSNIRNHATAALALGMVEQSMTYRVARSFFFSSFVSAWDTWDASMTFTSGYIPWPQQ